MRGVLPRRTLRPIPEAEGAGDAPGRLAHSAEGELPEIRAWRRAFAKMGLKPTRYRCASEPSGAVLTAVSPRFTFGVSGQGRDRQ
jgi:hypothetical protein